MVSLSVVVRKRTLITRMFTCVDCSCIDNNIIYILLWLTKQTSGSRMSFMYGALVTSGQLGDNLVMYFRSLIGSCRYHYFW